MANLRNSILTQAGINALYNGQLGSHFAVKYWLPVYDPRIDEDIHDPSIGQDTTTGADTTVLPLSGTDDITMTFANLEGEKILNAKSQYLRDHLGISVIDDVWKSQSGSVSIYLSATNITSLGDDYAGNVGRTSAGVTDSSQYIAGSANLLNNVSAFSDVISAVSLSGDNLGNFEGNNVVISKQSEPLYQLFGGSNLSATSLLYPIDGHTSISQAGTTSHAGVYSLRLDADEGDFRFNKFVLFISRMDVNGNEDLAVLPIPFSVTTFEGTNLKQVTDPTGNNLLWKATAQLSFTAPQTSIDVTNLVVSNWSDTTSAGFGLTTSQQVFLYTSGASPQHSSVAKFNIEDVGGTPHMAIGHSSVLDHRVFIQSMDISATVASTTADGYSSAVQAEESMLDFSKPIQAPHVIIADNSVSAFVASSPADSNIGSLSFVKNINDGGKNGEIGSIGSYVNPGLNTIASGYLKMSVHDLLDSSNLGSFIIASTNVIGTGYNKFSFGTDTYLESVFGTGTKSVLNVSRKVGDPVHTLRLMALGDGGSNQVSSIGPHEVVSNIVFGAIDKNGTLYSNGLDLASINVHAGNQAGTSFAAAANDSYITINVLSGANSVSVLVLDPFISTINAENLTFICLNLNISRF